MSTPRHPEDARWARCAAIHRAPARARLPVSRLQPDAAASLGMLAARAHLRVVGAAGATPIKTEERSGLESSLLDAWREAHWTLRLRMREVARLADTHDLESLYDTARRADNLLTEFYQARADVLTRRLRDALNHSGESAPAHPPLALVDRGEQALLGHFRKLGLEDRAALLRLASRLDTAATERSADG